MTALPRPIVDHTVPLLRMLGATGLSLLLLAAGSASLSAQTAVKPDPAPKKMSTETAPSADKKYAVPTDEELKKKLSGIQYSVARENGTERPFTNEFWQTTEEGIYVSIITGEPLFSSKDKFTSECGWPAFTKPINNSEIKELHDKTFGMERVEVRSKAGDAHLGHVFNDGPKDKGGLRYCINSASLRFIPKDKMAEAGYGDLLKQFDAPKK